MNHCKYVYLFVLGFSFITTSQATISVEKAKVNYSDSQSTNATQSTQAKNWGLSEQEWLRYKELMDGQLGTYSPNIDPLTALGISARNEEERRYYAELQVVAESARINRELAYQRAYDEAFKRLYPNLLPVNLSQTLPNSSLVNNNQNDRLVVFVEDNCIDCETKVRELQAKGYEFDLYMVGSEENDALIRRWATRVGIESNKVFARNITLNHDVGRWQSLQIDGDLPAVLKEVDGKWLRQ